MDCLEGENHIIENLSNDSCYIGRKLSTNRNVPGNIHKPEYREFWRNKVKPSKLVMDVIDHKYKLPFTSEPPRSFEGNNKSAREDLEFVKSELLRLEKLGCFKKVDKQPHLVLPLSVFFLRKNA